MSIRQSARTLTTGVVLLLLGATIGLGIVSGSEALVPVAGALVIAGNGFLAVGIHRLARNVDIAATAAHYAATVLDDSDDEPTAGGL